MQTSVSTYEQDKNTADSSNKNRTQCNDSREDYNWDEVRALESHWDQKKKKNAKKKQYIQRLLEEGEVVFCHHQLIQV